MEGPMTTPTTTPATPASPITPAPASPITPTPAEHTHPCARCGAPVALDVGLCERCNPLGLRDSASSQVHGTVFLAIIVGFIGLALAARLAVSGVGPFTAGVVDVRSAAGVLTASIRVTNEGTSSGSSTCRISDPALSGSGQATLVLTPTIGPKETITFDTRLDFGGEVRPLEIECSAP
jgi:hypothetical protein